AERYEVVAARYGLCGDFFVSCGMAARPGVGPLSTESPTAKKAEERKRNGKDRETVRGTAPDDRNGENGPPGRWIVSDPVRRDDGSLYGDGAGQPHPPSLLPADRRISRKDVRRRE